MLTVTKMFDICYGHQLPGYDGDCANFHGHNSQIEVEFGPPSECDQGKDYPTMVLDFSSIKKYVGEIIRQLDHRNLNEMFHYPTAEAITAWLVDTIRREVPFGHRLVRVRMYETPTSYAEWRRDGCFS